MPPKRKLKGKAAAEPTGYDELTEAASYQVHRVRADTGPLNISQLTLPPAQEDQATRYQFVNTYTPTCAVVDAITVH